MLRLLAVCCLAALVVSCASVAETRDQCTPQWPPGPCDTPTEPVKGK